MHHEMMAPKGPVALPKVLGREKVPEPTMDPTTMAVSVNSGSFCTAVLLVAAPLGEAVAATSAIVPPFRRGRDASACICMRPRESQASRGVRQRHVALQEKRLKLPIAMRHPRGSVISS